MLQPCEHLSPLLDGQVSPSSGHRLLHQAQHLQQQLRAGIGLTPVLRGIFLTATRSREMLVLISKKEPRLLQHSSALREHLEMQGSLLVPAAFAYNCDLFQFLLNLG